MLNYLKNEELAAAYEESKQAGEVTDSLSALFELLVNNLVLDRKFQEEVDKENEKIGALEYLTKYWNDFNPEKGYPPFAYYSEVAKRGMASAWNKRHGTGGYQKFVVN